MAEIIALSTCSAAKIQKSYEFVYAIPKSYLFSFMFSRPFSKYLEYIDNYEQELARKC